MRVFEEVDDDDCRGISPPASPPPGDDRPPVPVEVSHNPLADEGAPNDTLSGGGTCSYYHVEQGIHSTHL